MANSQKILLFGASGQVGSAIATQREVVALDRSQGDLTNLEAIRQAVLDHAPAVVINAAAYTAVDKAETESELNERVNATAPGVLAQACRDCGALFVHYSTDYVFEGNGTSPYKETDAPNPQSAYGRAKRNGEINVEAAGGNYLIFRLAWVYANTGKNFLNTMINLSKKVPTVRVVNDQRGAPTWAEAIARATLAAVDHEATSPGVYHMGSAGEATWYEFARAIFNLTGREIECLPITTEEYPTPARRPAYSVMDSERLAHTFGIRLPDWREQLDECWQMRPVEDR